MSLCGVVLLAGLAAGVAWRGRPFTAPPAEETPSVAGVARRFVLSSALVVLAGIPAGLCVIGAGGRLVMRLLAATAGPAAQGRITEAEEVVGRITVEGTIGFIVFNGIFGGVIGGAGYLLIRRFLPPGWLGGAVYGLGLLVVLGSTIDPLRRANPDFDIVGPGWLAVLVFTAMAVAFGVTLAGITARVSAWLPLPSRDRAVLVRYLAPAALAVVAFSVTIMLVAVGLVVVGLSRWRPLVIALRSRRALVVGRVLLVLPVLAFLPTSVSAIVDIAGRP